MACRRALTIFNEKILGCRFDSSFLLATFAANNLSHLKTIDMSGLQMRLRSRNYLLTEADMEGMVFNTPVPFYDTTVSCGKPIGTDEVPPVFMMMPDEMLGINDVICTRTTGDSMIGADIMPGDLIFIEKVAEYYSHDIVLADIDGERLLKSYYIDEKGDQWLVPANPKYSSIKLDGTKRVYFVGKLKYHLRNSPHLSMQCIVESINEAKAMMKLNSVASEEFKKLVVRPERAEKVIARLHELMDEKMKPKDILMPIRAAMEAGAIRRPTWAEFIAEFGSKRASKGSLSDYTDTTKDKFAGEPQYMSLVDDFRRLIAH